MAALLTADVPTSLQDLFSQASSQQTDAQDAIFQHQRDLESRLVTLMTDLQAVLATSNRAAAASRSSIDAHMSNQLEALRVIQDTVTQLMDVFKARANTLETTSKQVAEFLETMQSTLKARSADEQLCSKTNEDYSKVTEDEQTSSVWEKISELLARLAISVLCSAIGGADAVAVAQRAHPQPLLLDAPRYSGIFTAVNPYGVSRTYDEDGDIGDGGPSPGKQTGRFIEVVTQKHEEYSWYNSGNYLSAYDSTDNYSRVLESNVQPDSEAADASIRPQLEALRDEFESVWLSNPSVTYNDDNKDDKATDISGNGEGVYESDASSEFLPMTMQGSTPNIMRFTLGAIHDDSTAAAMSDHPVRGCLHCDAKFTGAYRRDNLSRHIRMKHKNTCRVNGCGKTFQRSDALLKHQRKAHPGIDLGSANPRSRTVEGNAPIERAQPDSRDAYGAEDVMQDVYEQTGWDTLENQEVQNGHSHFDLPWQEYGVLQSVPFS